MKQKLLLVCAFFFSYTAFFAQTCTPDPQYANEDFGAWPDTVENFPPAYQNYYYEEVLNFKIPADAGEIDPDFEGIEIDSFAVTDVVGLPPGLAYVCNSHTASPCTFLGGSQGCAVIYGTPTDLGMYEIVIEGLGYYTLPFIGVMSEPVEFENYRIEVIACNPPVDFALSNLTNESALISWTPISGEEEWNVIWGVEGFNPDTDGELVEGLMTPEVMISGLTAETTYDVYVQAVCDENIDSEWSMYSFTTASNDDCFMPSNISVTIDDAESVTVNWEQGNNENEWNLIWGLEGFDPQTEGEAVNGLNSPTHAISGLTEEVEYDVYIQAVCDVGDESDWAMKTFMISFSNVVDYMVERVKVYPNPATNQINFEFETLPAGSVRIYDMTGRLVETHTFTNNFLNIHLDQYSSGMFIYQVVDQEGRVVEKNKFSVMH